MDISEYAPSLLTFGRLSRAIEPSDSADLPNGPAKSIVVTAAGNLSFLPIDNEDSGLVTMAGLDVGYIVPFVIRRVLATGTTATVRTIED